MLDSSSKNSPQRIPLWYVFYTKSRHEKKVYERLTEDGFEVYLPLWKRMKQWSQRMKQVEEPVFKSYIFIRTMEKHIYEILGDPSIVKIIRFQGQPATISEKHLELIQKFIANNIEVNLTSEFKVGQQVKINGGAFIGLNGVIHEIRGKKHFQVVLEGSNLILTMDYNSISHNI